MTGLNDQYANALTLQSSDEHDMGSLGTKGIPSLDDNNSLDRRDMMISREDGGRIGSPRGGAVGGQMIHRMMQGSGTAKTT